MAIGDIVRQVRTQLKVEGSAEAIKDANFLSKEFGAVGRSADKLRRGIGRVFAIPAALGAAGAVGIVKNLFDVGRESEASELKLASMITQAGRFSNLAVGGFGQARMAAKELRGEIEQMAIASPATAKAIEQNFGALTLELSKAGVGLKDQIGIARDVTAREQLEGLQPGTTARDLRDILRGVKTKTQTASLLGVREEAADLAQEGKLEESLAVVQEALALSNEELNAFGESFEGKLATAEDKFIKLRRDAAEPLFEFLIEKLDEVTGFFSANEEQAREIAREIGENVVGAIETVIEGVKFIAENFDTIVSVAKTLATVWIGAALVGAISKVVTGVAQFHGFLVKSAALIKVMGGGGGFSGIGGALGGILGAVGGGLAIGEGVGRLVNSVADTGFSGGLLDVVTGNVKFEDSDEQKAINAREEAFIAKRFAEANKTAEVEKKRGVLDQKFAAVVAEDTKSRKKGRRRGRDIKIDKASLVIGNAELSGETFARLATPFVLQAFAQVAQNRPISADAGLSGGVSTPNGAGPGG